LGRLAIAFPLVFLFWILAAPVMNAVVTTVATPIIHILDWHDLTRDIQLDGDRVHFYYAPSDGKPVVADYRRISYNFVFLVALILAVPDVRPRLRLKTLIIGLLILFPIHVFRIVVFILNHYGQHMLSGDVTLYPFLYRKVLFYSYRLTLLLDGYLTPVVIWAGLFFYYKWNRIYMERFSKD
jgi:hypothetical protein